MKINCTQTLKFVNGEEIPYDKSGTPLTVGNSVAEILSASKMQGKYKGYILMERFYKEKELDLDEADFALVHQNIEMSDRFTTIVIGQLLKIFKEIKEAKA